MPNPVLERAAGELGATADAVALAAVLAQPWVDVVLSGVATREALASNLAAAELQLPENVLGELEEDSERVLEHALRPALELEPWAFGAVAEGAFRDTRPSRRDRVSLNASLRRIK